MTNLSLRRSPVLLVALLPVLLLSACAPKPAAPEPVRAVRTLKLGGGELQPMVDYAAEIRARTETDLSFRVGGKLLARPVDLGQTVRRGQLLARLDARDLQLGQDVAQAAEAAAKTSLELASANLKRYRALREQGFIGAAELEQHETTEKTARAQWEQALAQTQVQRNQTGYADLLADASGVITATPAEPGQVVAAGTPVVRLAHDGPRDAVFAVPETQVEAVRGLVGRSGAVQVKAWGQDARWPVVIREVAAAADPVTRTFLVKADVGAAELRLGRTATVSVRQPAQSGVLRLPLTALVSQQGHDAVWLLDPASMTVKPQPVQVARSEGSQVVVSAGLKAGDEVVTAGTHLLVAGQTVKRYVEPAKMAASR